MNFTTSFHNFDFKIAIIIFFAYVIVDGMYAFTL